jgi:predicted ABC-type sugar transport system permease subunit
MNMNRSRGIKISIEISYNTFLLTETQVYLTANALSHCSQDFLKYLTYGSSSNMKYILLMANNFVCVCIYIYIVTCMGVHVTKITGSRSDDWYYWHLGYKFS